MNKQSFLTFKEDAGFTPKNSSGKRFKLAKYICVCGEEKILRVADVKRLHTRSCGCKQSEWTIDRNTTHGLTKHPLYKIWGLIKQRCLNPDCEAYPLYGGSGVKICEEWEGDFVPFYTWAINNGWQMGLEIDKDLKGDGLLYGPETCSIVTHLDNCQERRTKRVITYNGISKTLSQWSRQLGFNRSLIRDRLKWGWSVHDALTTPASEPWGKKTEIRHTFGFINA